MKYKQTNFIVIFSKYNQLFRKTPSWTTTTNYFS